MIQRIQTVYLILAIIVNGLFFLTPVYGYADADPAGWLAMVLAAALTVSVILSIFAIGSFKNRPFQLRVCTYAMLAQVAAFGASVGVVLSMGAVSLESIGEWTGVFLLLLVWIVQYLAQRGIKKDEKLVRSMDRIR